MNDPKQLVELTSRFSDNGRHVLLQLMLQWPHGRSVGTNEICFLDRSGEVMCRVFKFTKEQLVINRKLSALVGLKQSLLQKFGGDVRPEGTVSLLMSKLSPAEVGSLIDTLLADECLFQIRPAHGQNIETIH